MNRSNGTPVDVSEIERFLGLPQTVAVPIFFATYIRCKRRRETRPGSAARAAIPGGVKLDRRKTIA